MKKNPSSFYIVWLGQLISCIGSGLTAFALGIYVFQLTGSATSYSLVILTSFLPGLLLKPIGGTMSDRINRKNLMILGDFGSAFGLIFIILMMHLGETNLWPIYLGTSISSIFVAIQNPAYKASISDLVDKDFYTKASSFMQLAEISKYLVSPILAGFMMRIMNIKEVLSIDAISFLFAIITVFWIKTGLPEVVDDNRNQNFLEDLKAGFKYVFNNKGIFWLISIISIVAFFIGLLQALIGPMILAFNNAEVLGISQTLSASGMLVGSIIMSIFSKSTRKIPILSKGLILCGIFFSLQGISSNIVFITLFGFMFFMILPWVNTSLDVLVRNNVANDMQGRIWSIVSLLSQLGMAIAFGVAGYLADKIFNPLLQPNGILSSTAGYIIGTGEGRGIGLMFIISGMMVLITAIVISRIDILRNLDSV